MPFPPINPALERTLAAQGYREPTPVQAAVLEQGGRDRDLLVSAQTGSGKTVGYGLAFAPTLLDEAERFGPAGAPLALIIAPTRELALQVHGELSWLSPRPTVAWSPAWAAWTPAANSARWPPAPTSSSAPPAG